MNPRRAISAVVVGTFALSGCSTSYAPKAHPRVAVVMQGGTPVYIREGRVFPGGGFGGDLREAVQGNSEAESYAKKYRTNMIAGVTTALAGVASAIGGGILYVSSSSRADSERNPTTEIIGGTLAVSGVIAYATGMVLMLNAQPHLWDAINSYNDGVDPGVSFRTYGTHLTAPASAGYAPVAPLVSSAREAPLVLPLVGAVESQSAAANSAKTAPVDVAPQRAPAAGPNPTPQELPPADVDLDLDAVEVK